MRRPADPFAALGLPTRPGLTDEDIRAAWRRVATATHPDRDDGGDPARFAGAAAAYQVLRTTSGRGEALADLAAAGRGGTGRSGTGRSGTGTAGSAATGAGARPLAALALVAWRIRHGRPGRVIARAAGAAAAGAAVILAGGTSPAVPAVLTGLLTWLVLTARHDLAPPP